MKQQIQSLRLTKQIYLLGIILLSANFYCSAQNWTNMFPTYGTYIQNHSLETVQQTFVHDNGTSFHDGRSILFRAVDYFGQQEILVTLLDEDGEEVQTPLPRNDRYNFAGLIDYTSSNLIPISAAYNSITEEYLVCGHADFDLSSFNHFKIWYIKFDKDLNVIDMNTVQTHISIFVTDVCAVEGNPDYDFAFTGRNPGWNVASYPETELSHTFNLNGELFLLQVDTYKPFHAVTDNSYIEFKMDKTLRSNDAYSFPASIIEINSGGPNDGYMISGRIRENNSNSDNGLFYIRTAYVAYPNNYSTYALGGAPTELGLFNAQQLKYENTGNGIVYVAGILKNNNHPMSFFFDRIDNANTINSMNFSSANWYGSGQPGLAVLQVPSFGGRIGNPDAWTYAEGIFDDLSSGLPFSKHIAGRTAETDFQDGPTSANASSVPYLFQVDYDPALFNFSNWGWGAGNNMTAYPRVDGAGLSTHRHPMFQAWMGGLRQMASPQLAIKLKSSVPGNELYRLHGSSIDPGTSIPGLLQTSLNQTDQDGHLSDFENSCLKFTDFARQVSVRMSDWKIGNGKVHRYETQQNYLNNNSQVYDAPLYVVNCNNYQLKPSPLSDKTEVEKVIWASNGILNWNNQVDNLTSIVIRTSTGKIVKTIKGESLKLQRVNLNDFSKGIYIAQYLKKTGSPITIKLIN